MKQDTPEASQVSEASKDYALAFDLAVRKGVSMTPDEAFHFRVCLTRFLKVFDEWKVSDQPRIARELKLKLFTCALVRNRFTMLIDSNVKVSLFLCLKNSMHDSKFHRPPSSSPTRKPSSAGPTPSTPPTWT